MEYQKIINLLDNENTLKKLEINDDRHGTYNTQNIKLKSKSV